MSAGEYSPDQIKKFQDLNEENEKLMKFLLKVKDAGKVVMVVKEGLAQEVVVVLLA